jgi:hypothetical protein
MQMDQERKKAMMEELKHYINGKFAELEKKLIPAKEVIEDKKTPTPKKVSREKAIRGK